MVCLKYVLDHVQQYLDFRRFEFRRFAPLSVFNYNHVSKFRRLLRSFDREPSCFFRRSVFEYKSFGVHCFLKLSALNLLYL